MSGKLKLGRFSMDRKLSGVVLLMLLLGGLVLLLTQINTIQKQRSRAAIGEMSETEPANNTWDGRDKNFNFGQIYNGSFDNSGTADWVETVYIDAGTVINMYMESSNLSGVTVNVYGNCSNGVGSPLLTLNSSPYALSGVAAPYSGTYCFQINNNNISNTASYYISLTSGTQTGCGALPEVTATSPTNEAKFTSIGNMNLEANVKFNTCNGTRSREIWTRDMTVPTQFSRLCFYSADTGDTTFQCNFAGLQDNHTYQWYATATNENGTSRSRTMTFAAGNIACTSFGWQIDSIKPIYANGKVGFKIVGDMPFFADCAGNNTAGQSPFVKTGTGLYYLRDAWKTVENVVDTIYLKPMFQVNNGSQQVNIYKCTDATSGGFPCTEVTEVSGQLITFENPPYQNGDMNADLCVNTQDYTMWLGHKDEGCPEI
jgi:hypothetical protein